MHVGTVGSLEVSEAEYVFAVRKLIDGRETFRFVGEPAKVPFPQYQRFRSLRHGHRGGLCRWESLVDCLVDEEQFGPERVPSDRQHDDTYADNKITFTHKILR